MNKAQQSANSSKMNFGTHREFREAVKWRLERNQIHEAVAIILENPGAVSGFWMDWAFKIKAGIIRILPPEEAEIPLLKDGDLFGEPITTGKLLPTNRG